MSTKDPTTPANVSFRQIVRTELRLSRTELRLSSGGYRDQNTSCCAALRLSPQCALLLLVDQAGRPLVWIDQK